MPQAAQRHTTKHSSAATPYQCSIRLDRERRSLTDRRASSAHRQAPREPPSHSGRQYLYAIGRARTPMLDPVRIASACAIGRYRQAAQPDDEREHRISSPRRCHAFRARRRQCGGILTSHRAPPSVDRTAPKCCRSSTPSVAEDFQLVLARPMPFCR